jgi:nitrite reductase (NO-forming) / hydroxylamine reductase
MPDMKTTLLTLMAFLPLFTAGLTWPSTEGIPQDELAKSMERGKEVYSVNCSSCHQASGEGLQGVYPPLASSDHLAKDPQKLISIVLKGQNEEITINGTKYSVPMAAFTQLTDKQVADVVNYIGNSWGNRLGSVTPEQVKSKR